MSQRKKHWIEDAVEKSGILKAAAKRSGESTAAYAEEHDEDPGRRGKRARLAETLMRLGKGK